MPECNEILQLSFLLYFFSFTFWLWHLGYIATKIYIHSVSLDRSYGCFFISRGVLDQILDGDVPSKFQKHARSLYQSFQNVYPTLYQFFKNICPTLYQFSENAYPTLYQLRKLLKLIPFLIPKLTTGHCYKYLYSNSNIVLHA